MKRLLAMILAFCMVLSMAACSSKLSSTEESETKTEENATQTTANRETEEEKGPIVIPQGFTVGWARTTVNPDPGTGMGGYGNQNDRLSATIMDDLYLTCTAVSDGENTVLIFSSDTIHVGSPIVKRISEVAEKKFGIPADNVIMNGTHTHSGPALYNTTFTGLARYAKKYYVAAEKVMDEALRDLAPATIFTGRGQTEGLNYVRRYVTLDGKTYLGNWPGKVDPSVGRHETEADPEVQVIRFGREGKKDVLLCNWQCHTTTTGGSSSTTVSADWVKGLRDKVEQDGDVLFSYHQGAAGNVVPISAISGEPSHNDHIKHGKAIADVVLSAMQNLTPVNSGKVLAKKVTLEGTLNPQYKKEQGISSRDTETYSLSVFAFGDVAFATLPGELFDTLGVKLKRESPYSMTFVCGYTNGTNGYLPAEYAWANGGYEVNATHFAKGTPEIMVNELLKMLGELHG